MPVPAPWLTPPDYVGSYLKGAALGVQSQESANRLAVEASSQNARIALAQQQMQQQAAETQQKLQIEQQLMQQKALENQQRMEISKQIHLAQIGLNQQRLEEVRRVNDSKIQHAASQFAAKQRIDQRIAAGEDPIQVMMQEGAGAGFTGASLAAIGKRAQVPEMPEVTEAYGQKWYRKGNEWSPLKDEQDRMAMMFGQGQLRDAQRERLKLVETASVSKKKAKELAPQIKESEERIDEILASLGKKPMFGGGTGSDWKQAGGFQVRIKGE